MTLSGSPSGFGAASFFGDSRLMSGEGAPMRLVKSYCYLNQSLVGGM
jgi:hypothetical protein